MQNTNIPRTIIVPRHDLNGAIGVLSALGIAAIFWAAIIFASWAFWPS